MLILIQLINRMYAQGLTTVAVTNILQDLEANPYSDYIIPLSEDLGVELFPRQVERLIAVSDKWESALAVVLMQRGEAA